MEFSFILNDIRFALELLGAISFLMAAWLMLDSFFMRKEAATFSRFLGFGAVALFQVIRALNLGNDLVSYVGYGLLLFGLFLIVGSFIKTQQLKVQAVIVIPTFALWVMYLDAAAAGLSIAVALMALYTSIHEMNRSWRPFSAAFLLFGATFGVSAYFGTHLTESMRAGMLVVEFLAFIALTRWVWQYLQLRIRESLMLILISSALFLSTVVTLAFSTILVGRVASETQANLLTDARVTDLVIESLTGEAHAKTALVAQNTELAQAVAKRDFVALESVAERVMEEQELGFLTVTDEDGSVLLRAHALSRRDDSLYGERALEEALDGRTFVTIEQSAVEKFSIRAGAPVVNNKKVVGAVIAGYPLDNAFVDGIKRITGLEVLIYDGAVSVAATAFAADGRTRMTGLPVTEPSIVSGVLGNGQIVTSPVTLNGELFLGSYLPIENGDGKIIGMIGAAKPQQDILDLADATNRLTLTTVILIMLVLTGPIYLFARRLSNEVTM